MNIVEISSRNRDSNELMFDEMLENLIKPIN
jgi:hypothetical protein